MPASVIVTGASGMLGRAVCQELKKNAPSWLVQGLAWSRSTADLIKVDVTSRSSVHELFQRFKVGDYSLTSVSSCDISGKQLYLTLLVTHLAQAAVIPQGCLLLSGLVHENAHPSTSKPI